MSHAKKYIQTIGGSLVAGSTRSISTKAFKNHLPFTIEPVKQETDKRILGLIRDIIGPLSANSHGSYWDGTVSYNRVAADKALAFLTQNQHVLFQPAIAMLPGVSKKSKIVKNADDDYFNAQVFGVLKEKISETTTPAFHINQERIQVFGDSATFDPLGSEIAYKTIKKLFTENPHATILYGGTGRKEIWKQGSKEYTTLDTNGAVNAYLDKHPERASQVVCNTVSYHTPLALKEWNCSISPHLKYFTVVHDRTNGKGGLFGDDTVLTDALTNTGCVLLEGGSQSLLQACRLLANRVSVYGVANLRGDCNPATKTPDTNKYVNYLTAADFLNHIKAIFKKEGREKAEQAAKKYLEQRPAINPHRADASTKQALFAEALDIVFKNDKFWENLGIRYSGIDCKREKQGQIKSRL